MPTQRAQISTKEAHYPHIVSIHDLENRHGDPGHPPKFIQLFLTSLQSYFENVIKSTQNLLLNGRILIGQSAW